MTVEGGGAGWAGKEVALMQPSGAFWSSIQTWKGRRLEQVRSGADDYRCRQCCDGTRDSRREEEL